MKIRICLLLGLLLSPAVHAGQDWPGLAAFIDDMVVTHQFERQQLEQLFRQVKVKQSILKAISRPAEKRIPWYRYRKIFVTQSRIRDGVKFWHHYQQTLARAEQHYGVPAEIIIAILGVETRYGKNKGRYRVIDALSTLAFHYPPRASFFRSELVKFLLLSRQENMSPLQPVGSYAGAMGWGQFMPSSYLAYAVDFNGDGHRNIWTDPVDAIGSIANYLARHGWVAGQSIAHPLASGQTVPDELLKKGYKPSWTREALRKAGINVENLPPGEGRLAVIALKQEQGNAYWLVRQNFYVITRYNHSSMYAMAVTQLADEIKKQFAGDKE